MTPNRAFLVLDLSTAHLPEAVINSLTGVDGVIAYEHGEYGYLLWVPEDPQGHANDYENETNPDAEDFPSEILAVQIYARSFGCDYVLFDRDADIDDALPTWEW